VTDTTRTRPESRKELEAALAAAESDLAQVRQELETARTQAREWEGTASGLVDQQAELESLREMVAAHDRNEGANQAPDAEVARLQAELDNSKSAMAELDREVERLEGWDAESQGKILELEQEVARLGEMNSRHPEHVADLNRLLDKSKAEAEKWRGAVETVQAELADVARAHKVCLDDLSKAQAEYDAHVRKLRDDNAKMAEALHAALEGSSPGSSPRLAHRILALELEMGEPPADVQDVALDLGEWRQLVTLAEQETQIQTGAEPPPARVPEAPPKVAPPPLATIDVEAEPTPTPAPSAPPAPQEAPVPETPTPTTPAPDDAVQRLVRAVESMERILASTHELEGKILATAEASYRNSYEALTLAKKAADQR
jgi:hypothetical protein